MEKRRYPFWFGALLGSLGALGAILVDRVSSPRPDAVFFTVQVNGQDSPVSCATTPSKGRYECTDTTHALTVSAGDRITLKTTRIE